MELLSDLWGFLKERKKYWLAPIIIVLVLLGVLIAMGLTQIADNVLFQPLIFSRAAQAHPPSGFRPRRSILRSSGTDRPISGFGRRRIGRRRAVFLWPYELSQ